MNNNSIPDNASRLHDEHKHRLEELEKNFKEKKEELSHLIQEYPITSMLVALAAGILIGKFIADRK
jgi:ElaB/YqjD/DUF883 family membrane-anchored ribosome-binding protein